MCTCRRRSIAFVSSNCCAAALRALCFCSLTTIFLAGASVAGPPVLRITAFSCLLDCWIFNGVCRVAAVEGWASLPFEIRLSFLITILY